MGDAARWCVWLGWAVGLGAAIELARAFRRVPRSDRRPLPTRPRTVVTLGAGVVVISLFLPWVRGVSRRTGEIIQPPGLYGLDALSLSLVAAIAAEAVVVAGRGGGTEPRDGFGGGGGRPAARLLWLPLLCAVLLLAGNQGLRIADAHPWPAWGSWLGLASAVVALGGALWARFGSDDTAGAVPGDEVDGDRSGDPGGASTP